MLKCSIKAQETAYPVLIIAMKTPTVIWSLVMVKILITAAVTDLQAHLRGVTSYLHSRWATLNKLVPPLQTDTLHVGISRVCVPAAVMDSSPASLPSVATTLFNIPCLPWLNVQPQAQGVSSVQIPCFIPNFLPFSPSGTNTHIPCYFNLRNHYYRVIFVWNAVA